MRTRVSERSIKRYVSAWKGGARNVPYKGGQHAIDETAKEVLNNAVAETEGKEAYDQDEFAKLLHQAMMDTSGRAGRASEKAPSTYLVKKWTKDLGISTTKGQDKSKARIEAENDPLAFLSTAVMYYNVFSTTPTHELVANFDATTFYVGGFDRGGGLLMSMKGRDQSKAVQKSVPAEYKNSLKFRWIPITTAGGTMSEIIFHFEWPELPPHEHYVFKVPGLSTSTELGASGYVTFTKTLKANDAWWEWYLKDYAIPFLVNSRIMVGSNLDEPCHLICDGEADQIINFANPEIVRKCREHNIHQDKGHPSTTGVAQSNDVGRLHRDTKARVKKYKYKKIINIGLEAALNDGPFVETNSKGYWNAARCRRAVHAIKLVHTVIIEVVSKKLIRESWAKVGFSVDGQKFCITQIAKQFNFKLNATDLAYLNEDIKVLRNRFQLDGMLTDDYMVRNSTWLQQEKIEKRMIARNIPRDELCFSQQRCLMLLHRGVLPFLSDWRSKLQKNKQERLKRKRAKTRKELAAETKKKVPRLAAGGGPAAAQLYHEADLSGDDDDDWSESDASSASDSESASDE